MANLKFSGFTAAAAIDQTDSFIVGFDNDGGGANPTNNKWTFPEVAVGLAAVTATPYSIYAADGTIGTTRKALITDTIQFRNAGDTSDVLSLNTNGNVEISGNTGMGVAVDTAVTLKVDASGPNDQMAIIAKGRNQTAGDYSLICQDSAATNLFIVENDGLVTVGKNLKVSGQGYTEQHDQTGVTISWNNSNVVYATLANGSQTFTPSDPKSGATYILYLRQPAAGAAGTVDWNSLVLWSGGTAPTLTATNGATDIITLIYNGTSTKYFGTSVLNFS